MTELVDKFYQDIQEMGGNRWDTSSLLKRLKKMTNFPESSDVNCQELLNASKKVYLNLLSQMKIDNLSEDFLEKIVIPIAYHLHSKFSKQE